VFASPFVGAGFSTTGAAPLPPPPGGSGAPGFFEQLQRASAQADDSDSTTETPAATPKALNASVPATVPAATPEARPKASSTDEFSSLDPDVIVSFVKPTQPAVTAPTGRVTSDSLPAVPRGSQRRTHSDDGSEVITGLHTPASGLPSGQNADLRSSIPVQAPASGNSFVLMSQPSATLLQMEGAISSTTPNQIQAAFYPMPAQLAFAARIKSEGAGVPPQSQPASGTNSVEHGDPASQPVKATGEASAKDGDPGSNEPEESAPPTSGLSSSAAKSSSRKDEADSAGSVVEPNAAPLTQLIPQSVSTGVADQPGMKANPAPAAQSAAAPEPTHVLPDAPVQASSPARTISLQVEAVSGQTVDIRIAARPGDLNVAVRSGDDAVTQDLRQGLGDLESRLAQSGYHAETWHPGHNGSTTEPAASGSNSSNSPSQQQSQSGSGWSQQNRGQRDNNPSNRPRWVNQLTSALNAGSTEKGNANGIIT
jgi:hypothetical protein